MLIQNCWSLTGLQTMTSQTSSLQLTLPKLPRTVTQAREQANVAIAVACGLLAFGLVLKLVLHD